MALTAPLLLGSGSPRRREILANLRVPFVVHVAAADETVHARRSSGRLSGARRAREARGRRRVYAPGSLARPTRCAPRRAVLVADTSVIDDGAILGKPADADEAEAMIARLAGRTHEVWTRFAIGSRRRHSAGRYAATPRP